MRARWIVIILVVGVLACVCVFISLVWRGGRLKAARVPGPDVRITNLQSGDRVPMEGVVLVQSETRDITNMVTQVELWVDGELQRVVGTKDAEGTPHFFAAQSWRASSPGLHTVMVRAVNGKGAASEEILVVEAVEGLVAVGPGGQETELRDLTTEAYVVALGETIEDIVEGRGVSQEDLLELNPGLDSDGPLWEGQLVEVPFDSENWIEAREEGEELGVGPQMGPEGGSGGVDGPIFVPAPVERSPLEGDPADLRITNFTPSNVNPGPGEVLVVGVTIMNVGGSAAENFHWAWDPGTGEEWVLDEAPITSLVPGDDVIREMAYTYEGTGQYAGRVWADSRERYAEPFEDDNFAYAAITVGEERLFEPVEPIPENALGDLQGLFPRDEPPATGRGGGPGEDDPPWAPTLEIRHEECEIIAEWCPGGENELGFYLERWDITTGGGFEQVAQFSAGQGCSSYGETVPRAGEYYYQMVAWNAAGEAVSQMIREQVTYDECSLLSCGLALLEAEVVGGDVRGDYENVYCYVGLGDLPEERVPADQSEFFQVEASHFDVDQYLGGENSRLVTVSVDDSLYVFAECWGWVPGATEPTNLGEFADFRYAQDWTGATLVGDGGGFRVLYLINRLVSPVCVEVSEYPAPPSAPHDLELVESRGEPALEWTWVGSEASIEGFWISCNGDRAQWVDKASTGRPRGEDNRYMAALDELLGSPHCGRGCNLSMVAGYRNEPMASDPGLNSSPSESVSHFAPACLSHVTVRFETIQFPSLDRPGDLVSGYFLADDQALYLSGLPDSGVFRPDGRVYQLEDLAARGDLIYRLEMVPAGEGVVAQQRPSAPELTVSLDWTTPLIVGVQIWELGMDSGGDVCYTSVAFTPGNPDVWQRVDTSQRELSGQGSAGSCIMTYSLHYGRSAD
jgi:hypothetical protein